MSVLITAISWARESNVWDKNEYTLDAQMEANAANAARDGLTIAHTFRERYSGVDLWIMPELTRLRSLIQSTPGRKIVYVYAQDRLVRGEEGEDIFWLLVEFRRYQAEVRFHLNPVDMSSIAGKIQMLIAGNEASNEIQKIYDRTWTRGRLRRMKEGKIPNCGPQKYGYRRIKETGKAEIVEEQATHIRRAADLKEQGFGYFSIAEIFAQEGIPSPTGRRWSSTAIRNFFVDPAYKGVGYGWRWSKKGGEIRVRDEADWIKLADDAYPAIIEPERWDRLNAQMQENKGIKARQGKVFYLLRGLVVCECGAAAYHVRCPNKNSPTNPRDPIYRHYQCSRKDVEKKKSGAPRTCFEPRANAPELEAMVWSQVVEILRTPGKIKELIQSAQPASERNFDEEIRLLQQAEAGKTKQIQNLAKRLRTASALIASHIESEMAMVETERRAIELQILRLQQEFANKKTQEQQTKSLSVIAAEIADKLDLLEAPMRREVLEALPFIYTLRGEVRIRPAVECPTAAI